MIDNFIIGQIIKQKREEKHLTQEQLADVLYVSKMAISKWENGRALPTIDKLSDISNILDVPEQQLYNLVANSEKQNKKGLQTMKQLTDVNTEMEYRILCEQIGDDFKAKHPNYKEPIFYMVQNAINYAIGVTIYDYQNKRNYCDYISAKDAIKDCLVFDDEYYMQAECVNRFELKYQLAKEEQSKNYTKLYDYVKEYKEVPNTTHKNMMLTLAIEGAERILSVVLEKEIVGNTFIKGIKNNAFVSELQVAFFQLEELFYDYDPDWA